MTTDAKHMTARDLLRLPDDGIRRELVQGELREMPPSGHTHGRVAMRFSWPLGQFVDEHDLGEVYAAETGFLLAEDPDTVRGADAAFVARERVTQVEDDRGYFPGAPDLAVEVISPGDRYAEVEAKVEEWLDAGCRMVVVVNPRNRTVKVYRGMTDITVLTGDDSFDGEEVVPGFRLALPRLFER
jgi:Uma2 family endonuclease